MQEQASNQDQSTDSSAKQNTGQNANSQLKWEKSSSGHAPFQLQEVADKYVEKKFSIQRKENNTGLPDQLKSGIENLSGYTMDDVNVHYNSSKPAQLQAHAYAQGTQIHLAPGQEKHLPHEAWHVVQQKQGRVKPTKQLKEKVTINDNVHLEKEADVMGAKASNFSQTKDKVLTQLKNQRQSSNPPTQLSAKGAAAGAAAGLASGAAIGALGFFAGPVVGAITTAVGAAIGAGVGAIAGHHLTKSEIDNLNADLENHLQTAMATPKFGGSLAFQNYLTDPLTPVSQGTRDNAQALLNMVWALNQVSGFIVNSIAGKTPAEAEKIMDTYIATARNTLRTSRQPWGAGNVAYYVANPAYFQSIFSGPIDFLNAQFPGMPAANRLIMLTSVQGWDQQKGPAQLAEDLLIQDYNPPPARAQQTLPNADFTKFVDDIDSSLLTSAPNTGDNITDFNGDSWLVSATTPATFTIDPI